MKIKGLIQGFQCILDNVLTLEVENNQIKLHKIIENALAHGGGGCPAVGEMLKYKIDYIIFGGMESGAKMKFENA